MPRCLPMLTLALGLLGMTGIQAGTPYSSDFDTFQVGDDLLGGQDGWQVTGRGSGISGVIADAVTGLGRSGFVGYGLPTSSPIRVTHGLVLSPDGPIPNKVSLQGLAGVATSTVGGDDVFRIAIRLPDASLLASIAFDLQSSTYGIWSQTPTSKTLSDTILAVDHVYQFLVELDLDRRVWSAHLDGFPVVVDAAMPAFDSAGIRAATFSFEWEVADLSNPGDNWMIFDELQVTSQDPLIVSLRPRVEGGVELSWTAPVAGSYQAQWSHDLTLWQPLDGGTASATLPGGTLSVVDPAQTASSRFYRISPRSP